MSDHLALDADPAPATPGAPLELRWPRPLDVRSVALYGILALLVFHTLRVAAYLLLPMVFAILASFALSPLVRALSRARIPRPVGAALVVLLFVGGVGATAGLVAGPAAEWLERAPNALRQIERKVAPVRKPIEDVAVATEQVEELTSVAPKKRQSVEVAPSESLLELVFVGARDFLASAVIVLVLLYFLLASGDAFTTKLVSTIPRFREKQRAAEFLSEVEHDVSHYLLLVIAINLTLGAVVATAMFLLGMPNPALWGVLATVTNFVPFLGAMLGTVLVGLAAVLSFETLGQAILVPITYACLTGFEGLVITPSVLGSRLTLSPVLVFVSVLVWSWLWGIPGALVAVPLLAVTKMVADRVEPLRPLGRLMGAA